ncbi:TetR/AcrR family transcriptional regulator [Streptomyces sp. NPDC056405]|uniref:TetR/AcrR family transcriptional regulator n=1 Tax=Streptomyces sp. NPDC056405 TaxID=3345811 RepID=UPI0035DEF6A8
MADTFKRRTPSQWGEGHALKEEILAAAARMLAEAGREEGLSLRSVAREVGISAPSIYLHFEDRSSLVAAVTQREYEGMVNDLRRAWAEAEDEGPREALRAMAQRYCSFALENARRYRLMFAVEWAAVPRGEAPRHPVTLVLRAWQVALASCREAGYARVDDEEDAILLWSSLHGMAALAMALPFEREADGLTARVDTLVDRIVTE